ncbi:MAG: transposase, partial [Candidatus Thiodiazotropha taylori]
LFLVREKPSISLGELKEKLHQNCNIRVTKQTISYFLKKTHTRKVLVRPAAERFTDRNLIYTQVFIDVLHRADANRIKFFDESGFKLPGICNPKYGHSLKGERAIEVHRYAQTPNVTLNLLISSQGVSYANVVQGPSNTDTYTQFFFDALNSTTNQGDLSLKPGDLVIIDNCPIHRHRAQNILGPYLDRFGIEYIFTPTYSPNLNAAELCFQHIKTLFKRQDIRDMALDNLEYAVMFCVNSISSQDCKGYYQHIGYLRA